MWFAFGVVTLCAFFLYSFINRARANWTATNAQYEGVDYLWQSQENKGHSLTRIGVGIPDDFEFRLREETDLDRWFKRIGINAEMALDDPLFERRVYVESNDPLVARLLREREDLRRGLTEAMRKVRSRSGSFGAIHAGGSRLWVQIGHHSGVRPIRYVPVVLPLLQGLAEGLRRLALRAPLEQRDPFIVRAAIVLALSTSSCALGLIGFQWWSFGAEPIVDPGALLAASLIPGLAIHAALIWFTLRWLGRSARSHLVLVELLLLGTLGVLSSTFWLMREANIAFDSAVPSIHEYRGASAERRTARRRGDSYWLHLQAAPPGAPGFTSLRIDRTTYGRLRSAPNAIQGPWPRELEPIRITLRPGFLGHPWVERIDSLSAASAQRDSDTQ